MIKHKKTTALLVILLALFLVPTAYNQFSGDYSDLNATDREILSELDAYAKANMDEPMWPGFDLYKTPVLAVNGTLGKAFLINPSSEVSSIFAKEIKMPKDSAIKVYRVSASSPQLMQFKLPGSFNTFGKTYTIMGSDVYYTKYDESSLGIKYDSGHYITFLAHEAFHYYTQKDWDTAGRFDTEVLTATDLDLLEEYYTVLEKIQTNLSSENPDRGTLLSLTREYLDITEKRMTANPSYMKDETITETSEGTATYIGILASDAVNYDFDVMHFSKDGEDVVIPFSKLVPAIKSGEMDKSSIASNLVYESGALLCLLMDELGVPDWQETLNAQALDSPVTLYSVLSEYMANESASSGR